MGNIIKYVNIHNFKSISDLKLEDCRRINLFIGYPNVGKSNVLEAIGLFSIEYLEQDEKLNKIIRVEKLNDLFYDLQNTESFVDTNLIKFSLINDKHSLNINPNRGIEIGDGVEIVQNLIFGEDFKLKENLKKNYDYGIKRYTFSKNNEWKSANYNFLLPPYGENITSVLSQDFLSDIKNTNEWIENELKKNNLDYVLDLSDNTIKSQKRLGGRYVRSLPYSSLADTLQRVIFYKTAIASNTNSVLLFEEPEAHAFPPYIKTITQDIIDAKTNQFFIVTHSPYIITDFLEYEDLRKEVAIYLFDYKNDQTTVKRLTDKEIDEVYNYDVDLFFNIERFLRDE